MPMVPWLRRSMYYMKCHPNISEYPRTWEVPYSHLSTALWLLNHKQLLQALTAAH